MTYEIYFFLVTARTSGGLYPELPPTPPAAQPSAPPCDEGYLGSSGMSSTDSGGSRGILRPHSESPFLRNVRARTEEVDMEAISCLLDFARRELRTPPPPAISTVGSFSASGATSGSPEVLVRTFKTTTPKTPATAPRPDCPPRMASRRVFPPDTPRPRALRRPPSAALGAPPRQEGEEEESTEMELELPDIPDTPQSPAVSDITVLRLVLFFIYFFANIFFLMPNIFISHANFFF